MTPLNTPDMLEATRLAREGRLAEASAPREAAAPHASAVRPPTRVLAAAKRFNAAFL